MLLTNVSKLKVWWKPQVPCKSFEVEVDSVTDGVKLMDTLANYDLFQLENNIKPDYANIGGINYKSSLSDLWLDVAVEVDGEVNGETYIEYFDDPRDFISWLDEVGVTEQELYDLETIKITF